MARIAFVTATAETCIKPNLDTKYVSTKPKMV
jgi:hypothetical protein